VRKGGAAQVEPVGAAQGNDDNAPRRRGRPPKLRPVANLFTDGGPDSAQDEAPASLQS
jgi:hypothetical protein